MSENKFYETGSNPYYLNINNTAKDYSLNESSNPQSGLLYIMSKHTIIINDLIEEETNIIEEIHYGDNTDPLFTTSDF
ncbi:MAG: hypothetical protein JSS91_00715 [Bacteroidetes bacterium]|nr:hypothetical protein [Bacteroidota bacterium]